MLNCNISCLWYISLCTKCTYWPIFIHKINIEMFYVPKQVSAPKIKVSVRLYTEVSTAVPPGHTADSSLRLWNLKLSSPLCHYCVPIAGRQRDINNNHLDKATLLAGGLVCLCGSHNGITVKIGLFHDRFFQYIWSNKTW